MRPWNSCVQQRPKQPRPLLSLLSFLFSFWQFCRFLKGKGSSTKKYWMCFLPEHFFVSTDVFFEKIVVLTNDQVTKIHSFPSFCVQNTSSWENPQFVWSYAQFFAASKKTSAVQSYIISSGCLTRFSGWFCLVIQQFLFQVVELASRQNLIKTNTSK